MFPQWPPLCFILLPALAALAFYPAVRRTGGGRAIAFAVLMTIAFLAPLGIDPQRRALRLVAALATAWMTSKLYAAHFGVSPDERPGFGQYAIWLCNPFWMVRRLTPPNTRRLDDAKRLLVRLALAAVACAACVGVFHVHWSAWPFALEHAAKAVTIMSSIIFTANATAAGWRVAGGRGLDFTGAFPLLAATPAEFWRRWNQSAQQFFRTFVASPRGGMRRPIDATLATFAVSAAGHEYIFSMAVGRLQGYQTAFFLIHGLAVIAMLRVRPTGWRRLPWWAVTFAFLLVTTVLFGLSVNEILPIYDARG